MAIYHLHVQTIGRGSGKSAIAAAAYRSTTRLTDNETGIICDYSKKEKAIDSGIIAPLDAPEWVRDRGKLWNEIQAKENRKNSQFAWEYDIALPAEIKNWKMINDFCQENFVSKGLICDYAVHKPNKQGDQRNYHVHIMVTTREMTSDGWGKKYRHGENKMSDRIEWLKEIRKSWENICNEHLQKIGSKERIDCRTLEAQGIDRMPQRHQGATATAMERKGKNPNRTRTIPEVKEQPEEAIWEEENELKQLLEEKKIWDLSEDGFKKEYKKWLDTGEMISQAKATRDYLPEIEKENFLEEKQRKKQVSELKKSRPHGVAERGNVLKSFFLNWITDDGKEFDKHEDYAKHQEALIAAWKKKAMPLEEQKKSIEDERKIIEKVKKYSPANQKEEIKQCLELFKKQENRPALFEKIKQKAIELLDKAVEFTQYRNKLKVFEEIRESMKETARQRTQKRGQTQGKEMKI